MEWLGEVPKHWTVAPLKFSASCNDTTLPESIDDDYEMEYVEISDVNEVAGITGSTSYRFSDAPSSRLLKYTHKAQPLFPPK